MTPESAHREKPMDALCRDVIDYELSQVIRIGVMPPGRVIVIPFAGFVPLLGMLVLGAVLVISTGMAARDHGRDEAPAREQAGGMAGRLLVASESMSDPRFRRSIIFMIDHDETGAFGVIVNQPLGEVPIAELLKRMDQDPIGAAGKVTVYVGGPVEPERGLFLHSRDVMPPGSLPVTDEVAWSADIRVLRMLGTDKGPRRVILAFGYAGWGPGQLESELAEGAWFILPSRGDLVFAEHPSQSWSRALGMRGIEL